VAFLVTMIASLTLVLVRFLARDAGPVVGPILEDISVSSRYSSLGRGVVDLRDLLYFASFGGFFLYLNAETVENRRYH
jgi:ABC-2 type transport system permease protein